jgi:hypothetical protein
MKGLVDLEGMEGVTSTGVNKGGHSMELNANPILTSTCALTNTKYLTTLFIGSNPKLVVCPLSTMARAADVSGVTIMHNTTCPSAGVLGSTGGITIIVIGTLVALVCVVGFLYMKRRSEPVDDKAQPLLGNDSLGIEMALQATEVARKETEEETTRKEIEREEQARIDAEEGANGVVVDVAASPAVTTLSTGRSEVAFDELKQATSGFNQSLEVGDGGSCRVYRATVDGIPCAIKVLAKDATCHRAGGEAVYTAEVDLLLLRCARHQNLCRLYASSTDGPRKCLVLELMEGGALDKRLIAQPLLGWQQRVSIALDTCRGLDYLHSLSPPMIHRDIKSQNILLTGYKSNLLDTISMAKVADFGTVRTDDRNKNGIYSTRDKTHASTNMVVGTTPYMPAEYTGRGHVSEKTDAFAMGIVIIELLISGAIKAEHAETFPLQAREKVDSADPEDLSAELQALAARGGWAGSKDAQRAAKILADVAVSCTRGTTKRQKPAEVLGQLEAAHRLTSSASASGGGGWFS